LEPRARQSDAADAAFLATRYGLEPDPWQFLVLKSWLGVRADGQWASRRCGLAVPRQNGKNGIIEIRELFGMVVLGEKFLHTAHEVKTARKAFIRLCSFFENPHFPELMALVSEIRKTNGQEAIILRNGGSCEFVARSKGSARGFTVDVLVMDEAQELGEDAIEALLPTISASPSGNPQQIFTGTPPGPKANGEIFTRVRSDGLLRKDKALSWHEWSCLPDADLDDLKNVAKTNPALGIRLHLDVVLAERGTLSDSGFGRERLGMWDEVSAARVIGSVTWSNVADVSSVPSSEFALAVGVNPDRSSAAVGFAGLRSDGLWHFEMDEQRTGVGWVAGYIVQKLRDNPGKIRAVVVNGSSPAKTVVDDLLAKKVKTTVLNANEVAEAFGKFYDAVSEGTVRHTDQPQVSAALSVARKRDLAGGSAWSQKHSTSDITPIEACTFALWGAQVDRTRLKRPGGRGRVPGERNPTGNRVGSML
jgi:hypothetical protein